MPLNLLDYVLIGYYMNLISPVTMHNRVTKFSSYYQGQDPRFRLVCVNQITLASVHRLEAAALIRVSDIQYSTVSRGYTVDFAILKKP